MDETTRQRRFALLMITGFLLGWAMFTCQMRPAYGQDKAKIAVSEKQARELIAASSEAEHLRVQAELARTRAMAAQLLYDKLYYKLAAELKIDLEQFEIKREGDAVFFIPKEQGGKIEKTKQSPADGGP